MTSLSQLEEYAGVWVAERMLGSRCTTAPLLDLRVISLILAVEKPFLDLCIIPGGFRGKTMLT